MPDLESFIYLAAMRVISGKDELEIAQLLQQNPEQYQQLAEIVALFPQCEGVTNVSAALHKIYDKLAGLIPTFSQRKRGFGKNHASYKQTENPRS